VWKKGIEHRDSQSELTKKKAEYTQKKLFLNFLEGLLVFLDIYFNEKIRNGRR